MKPFVLTLLALVLSLTAANTQIYFVDMENGDDAWPGSIDQPWQRLDTAIHRLHPGDTLFVRQGDYTGLGPIIFQKSGTSASPVIISGYENEYPIIEGFTVGFSKWLEIRGLSFRGPQQLPDGWVDMPITIVDQPEINTDAALSWMGPDYRIDSVLLKYSTYARFLNYGYFPEPTWESQPSFGVRLSNCSHISITDNLISMHTYGLRLSNNSANLTISGNTIDHCLDGISGFCNPAGYQYSFGHSFIADNDISQSFRNGIMLNYGAHHNIVENNFVSYSGQNHISTYNLDIQSDSAGYNTITNNFVSYGGYYADFMQFPGPSGISLHSPGPGTAAIGNYIAYQVSNAYRNGKLIDGNCMISDNNPYGSAFINNVCYRPMGNGFAIVRAGNNTFIHNTVLEAGYGDPVSNNNGFSIKIVEEEDVGNILYNNILAEAARGGIYAQYPILEAQVAVNHNLYFQSNGTPLAGNGANQIFVDLPFSSLGLELNGLEMNPQIADSLGRIASGSPAIGLGGLEYTYPTDWAGNPRSAENPTVGAYEGTITVGVQNDAQEEKSNLRIYPNPTAQFLTIENTGLYDSSSRMFRLFDLNGRLVLERELNDSKVNTISLERLQNGMYFYRYSILFGKIFKLKSPSR